jgi:GMP synthase (glutamine-hydrolysing)
MAKSTKFLTHPFKTIRGINLPLLGICGGHQLLALSYGGQVAPIKIIDSTLPGYTGCWRERGYLSIRNLKQNDPIFEGLKNEITVFENHCEEVKT